MSNKRIGILMKKFDTSFGITFPYIQFFEDYGTVIGVNPYEIVKDLDLLVLPGGPDVDTKRYNERPGWATGNPDNTMEYFDANLLPEYIKLGIPIAGICRGAQSINVLFGGTLHQHIFKHPTSDSKNREELVHNVEEFDNASRKTIPNTSFKVNSLHHQSINRLGEDLEVTLVHKIPEKDRTWSSVSKYAHNFHNMFIIEGIKHKTLPIEAWQFHPEHLIGTPAGDYVGQKVENLLNYKKELITSE